MTTNTKRLIESIRERGGSGQFGYGIATADRYVADVLDAVGKGMAVRYFRCIGNGTDLLLKRAAETLTFCGEDTKTEKIETNVAAMRKLLGAEPPPHSMMAIVNRLTTPREDRDGDTLQTKGANLDPKAPLLWQHVHTLPIGKMVKVVEKSDEVLKVSTVLLDINELTADAGKLVEAGVLRFSHGFIPQKFEERKGGAMARFNVLEYDIVEESLVSVPSNVDAEIELFARGKLASPVFKAHAKHFFDARNKSMAVTEKAKLAVSSGDWDSATSVSSPSTRERPSLRKMFDIATQRVEPTSMECDWAARFIGCSVKDLHVHTTAAQGLYIGSLLEGFERACVKFQCLDCRNLNGTSESPPVYETRELNSTWSKNFLIEGVRFYAGEGRKFVVRTWQGWGSQNFVVYSDSAEWAQEPIEEAWKFVNDLNPLKGEAFALTGGFIPKTGTAWSDVFLSEPTEKSLRRTVRIINEKGINASNRGLILMGGPGTGKTLSCRVMLNEAECTFIWVSPKDFYRGGGFCEAFALAKSLAPSILMFEDIDNWMSDHAVDLIKTEMDGLQQSTGVTTILTTNFPDQLPAALIDRPGRFHDVLEIHLPSKDVRLRMLQKWASDATLDSLAKMADDTDGYSGAHVYELCHFAKVIRDEEECSLDDALTKAFAKVKDQRDLINQNQLSGSSYRPGRRELEAAMSKGWRGSKAGFPQEMLQAMQNDSAKDGAISGGQIGPVPNQGESQAVFMERCMLDPMMMGDYPTEADRQAACKVQWGKSAATDTKEMGECKKCGKKAMLNDDGYCAKCAKTAEKPGDKPASKPDAPESPMPRGAKPASKSGRVLSQRNYDALVDALEDLSDCSKLEIPRAAKALLLSSMGKIKSVVEAAAKPETPEDGMADGKTPTVESAFEDAVLMVGEDRQLRDRMRKLLDTFDEADELEQVGEDFRLLTTG